MLVFANMDGNALMAAKARSKVRRAIIKGLIPFPYLLACVDCGKKAQIYEHRDYTKPLEVVPVCRCCNSKRGPAIQMNAYHIRYMLK